LTRTKGGLLVVYGKTTKEVQQERGMKMSWEVDIPFDLEKIRLEKLSRLIKEALTEFEERPSIWWTQTRMEKPLWETLQIAVQKQIGILPNFKGPTNEAKDDVEIYCPECGYYFENDLSFCPDCGQKILRF